MRARLLQKIRNIVENIELQKAIAGRKVRPLISFALPHFQDKFLSTNPQTLQFSTRFAEFLSTNPQTLQSSTRFAEFLSTNPQTLQFSTRFAEFVSVSQDCGTECIATKIKNFLKMMNPHHYEEQSDVVIRLACKNGLPREISFSRNDSALIHPFTHSLNHFQAERWCVCQ